MFSSKMWIIERSALPLCSAKSPISLIHRRFPIFFPISFILKSAHRSRRSALIHNINMIFKIQNAVAKYNMILNLYVAIIINKGNARTVTTHTISVMYFTILRDIRDGLYTFKIWSIINNTERAVIDITVQLLS
jgi:hypothetical protein